MEKEKNRWHIIHHPQQIIHKMTNSPTPKVTFERLKNSPSKLKKTPINDFAFLPYICNVDKEQKFLAKQTKEQNNKISI